MNPAPSKYFLEGVIVVKSGVNKNIKLEQKEGAG